MSGIPGSFYEKLHSQNSDYKMEFLRILNNQGKASNRANLPVRTRGFVVIVRGASNLKPIQSLCFDQLPSYSECLTARYRLQAEMAIGTLMRALLSDLAKIVRSQKDLAGDLVPDDSEDRWKQLAERIMGAPIEPSLGDRLPSESNSLKHVERGSSDKNELNGMRQSLPQGVIAKHEMHLILQALRSESMLGIGRRLVLLGEISEEAADLSEWQTAMEVVFNQLPERVGIVLSGAPKDFTLPKHDPHFLEITLPKDDGVQDERQGQFAYKYTDSSFHSDEPANKDQLGVKDYANALARFVMHPQTKPPLTIGIHGPWGKGKSSFMRLIDSALVKYVDVNRNLKRPELNGETHFQYWNDLVAKLIPAEAKIQAGLASKQEQEEYEKNSRAEEDLWGVMRREAEKNVLSLTFNAWQFEDAKQTWAGLASQISERMEATLRWPSRQWLKVKYAWKERKAELVLSVLLPLAVIFLVAGLVILGSFRNIIPPEKNDEPLGILLKILLPAGSALFTIWFVSSQVLKVAQPVSQRVLSYVRMYNYREQMGFQHRVKDDLRFVHRFLTKRRPGCRVVVYIDDLDRCSENKVMEILQAINLILGSCEFLVFVGMDTEMIYRAIKSYYKGNVSEGFPDNYLRKIIQISFYLPETISQARADYLSTLFSSAARFELGSRKELADREEQEKRNRGLKSQDGALGYDLSHLLKIVPVQLKEAEDTADELQAFRDYTDFLDDNPREIKRLINIHRLIKILLQKQNTSWSSERQRKLVKWLIFCDRWPHLVDDILTQKDQFQSPNSLAKLVENLEELEKDPKGAGSVPNFDGLKDFAQFSNEKNGKPLDALSAADIDDDFRRAANLSQLVHKSPAPHER